MRYRAVALDVTDDGHPVEIFGSTIAPVRSWAKTISDKHGVPVVVYESVEKEMFTIQPPEKPPSVIPQVECSYNHETLKSEHARATCPSCGITLK